MLPNGMINQESREGCNLDLCHCDRVVQMWLMTADSVASPMHLLIYAERLCTLLQYSYLISQLSSKLIYICTGMHA